MVQESPCPYFELEMHFVLVKRVQTTFGGVEILQPIDREISAAVYFRRNGEQEKNSTGKEATLRRRLVVDMNELFGRIILPRTDRRRNNYLRVQGFHHQPRHKTRRQKSSKVRNRFLPCSIVFNMQEPEI